MKIHTDIIQGTPEWHAVRCGKITGTGMNTILQKGKSSPFGAGAITYAYTLAEERITGQQDTGPDLAVFSRGHDHEVVAMDLYQRRNFVKVTEVGFIEVCSFFGVSPDGLIGDKGGIEFKSLADPVKWLRLVDGNIKIPNDHFIQIQANLYASRREWWEYVVYNSKFNDYHCIRVERDEEKIEQIKERLPKFNQFVNDIVKRLNEKVRYSPVVEQ